MKLTNRNNWHKSRRPALSVERLEVRQVPTTLVLLDFDGVSRDESAAALRALHRPGAWEAAAQPAFVGAFTTLGTEHSWADGARRGGYAEFSFLDFNRDGRLDAVDGEIAAGRI